MRGKPQNATGRRRHSCDTDRPSTTGLGGPRGCGWHCLMKVFLSSECYKLHQKLHQFCSRMPNLQVYRLLLRFDWQCDVKVLELTSKFGRSLCLLRTLLATATGYKLRPACQTKPRWSTSPQDLSGRARTMTGGTEANGRVSECTLIFCCLTPQAKFVVACGTLSKSMRQHEAPSSPFLACGSRLRILLRQTGIGNGRCSLTYGTWFATGYKF